MEVIALYEAGSGIDSGNRRKRPTIGNGKINGAEAITQCDGGQLRHVKPAMPEGELANRATLRYTAPRIP